MTIRTRVIDLACFLYEKSYRDMGYAEPHVPWKKVTDDIREPYIKNAAATLNFIQNNEESHD